MLDFLRVSFNNDSRVVQPGPESLQASKLTKPQNHTLDHRAV